MSVCLLPNVKPLGSADFFVALNEAPVGVAESICSVFEQISSNKKSKFKIIAKNSKSTLINLLDWVKNQFQLYHHFDCLVG